MKLIEFKEFNRDNISQELNKRKVTITIGISILLILILIFVLLYIYNEKVRNWADNHILLKNVSEGKLSYIDYDKSENISIYAYDKYIALASINKLQIYNSSAKQIGNIDINFSNPIFNSNGKYMVVGDKGKQHICVISGAKIMWKTDLEGTVSKVSINENGYVSVVCVGSTYKSVIFVYNSSGEQLFKTYIPNNTVIDSTISSDNKFLSFAEVDTSRATIESKVKTISIKDAKEAPQNAIISTYDIPSNALVVNIKYQGSKNILCMCDNGIYSLSDNKSELLMNFEQEEKKYAFAGINLSNTIYEIEECSDGIVNQESNIVLINSATRKNKTYKIDGIAKDTSSSDNNIAINLGTKVYFINSRGWLIKKYTANQEVKDVIVADRIAAIVFRDKIEILIL